jgi:hypothetical protein
VDKSNLRQKALQQRDEAIDNVRSQYTNEREMILAQLD